MNKGQGCSTSEYKYVGSLQVTVMDENAMCGEINKLGFRGYFVAECPNGHPYYVGEVSDAFTAILKVTSLKMTCTLVTNSTYLFSWFIFT